MECSKCPEVHERCKAHNRAGKPCKKWPLAEQRVCEMHGGKTPAALEKAAVRAAEKKIASLGLRREGLTAEQLVTEVVERAGADLEYVATMAQGGDPVWVKALGEVTDRAARVGKIGVDANLGARKQALDEATAEQLLTIVQQAVQQIPPEYAKVVVGEIVSRVRAIEN